MARKRSISTDISLDERVNDLAVEYGDFAALLYTWMIPHAEDDGCIRASATKLLFMVAPMRRDKSAADISAALDGMERLGLIETNWASGVISFPAEAFYRYQTYVKPDRRRKSENDAPSIDSTSGSETVGEVPRTSEKNPALHSHSHSHPHSHSPSHTEESRVRALPPAAVSETADVLSQASWINDEVGDIETAVSRAFRLVADFDTRDGPVEAEKFALHHAKKPPSDWYRAFLNWLKKAVEIRLEREAARPKPKTQPQAELTEIGGMVGHVYR